MIDSNAKLRSIQMPFCTWLNARLLLIRKQLFQFFTGKSRDLLNPFRRPAYIPKPAGYFPRHFKSPLFKTLVETFLYKTFCNRHAVCSAPADKKARHFAGLCGSHQ
ncbi:hypothetical protein Q9X69_002826 [Salmonella enterica subsp. enterica serovar Brandenburg]|nr:hypothetical protein [Escherichia coli]ELH5389252.1 hypothetical protein [Salmonella enterica subsp. enterica serovar Brandenburg]